MNTLKKTKGRRAVLEILEEEASPVDVAHIYTHLQEKKLSLDQATVYRILDTFLQRGVVRRFEFGEGKFRYEISGEDHHHLICERCGAIEDISDCGIGTLEKEIQKKKGFLVKHHALEFFGLCQNCQH